MTELDNLLERQLVRKIDIAKRGGVIFTILFNSYSASPLSICLPLIIKNDFLFQLKSSFRFQNI